MNGLSEDTKQKIQQLIFERAYEIEQQLSEQNYLLADMACVRPEQVSEVALRCAVKELKREFQK